MDNILQIDNLKKDYGDFLLDNVSFSVPSGAIVGLIGENGAGKTTTINLILHTIEKDDGKITVFGKDHLQYETEIKQQVGFITDECNYPELLTVSDVEQFMKLMYPLWKHKVFKETISKFELPINKPIKEFSKGMKIKLNFAVALSHDAKLLILDEATSGLDPVVRDEVLDLLLDFVQDENHSVLFSSHITSDLEKVADYIVFLHKGKLIFCKRKDDLIYHYGIIRCGAAGFDSLNKADIIKYQKQDYEWQALVSDREAAKKKYKNCVVDNATIDEIMLLYIRGE